MRPGGVRRERECAPVLAGLHLAAHEAHLGVGGVQHRGGAFEAGQRRLGVAARESGFGRVELRRAHFHQHRILNPKVGDRCGRAWRIRRVARSPER